MIGMITDFQVFDGFIYVLDALAAKSLFVFDMDGKFVRKIGQMGRGPGEYSEPFDFTMDTKNRYIFLRDGANRILK